MHACARTWRYMLSARPRNFFAFSAFSSDFSCTQTMLQQLAVPTQQLHTQ